MSIAGQAIGCAQGDTFPFEIDLQATDDPVPDLTGAAAQWVLAESWFDGAKVYVTKAVGSGVTLQNDAGVWKIIVSLLPADTANIPPGTLFHETKVTLSNGVVSHVTTGPFELMPSVNP
jgi:hypothetical protein